MLGNNARLKQLKLLDWRCTGNLDLTGLPALEALRIGSAAASRQPLPSLRSLEVCKPAQASTLAGRVPNLRCLAVTGNCDGAQLDALLQQFSGVDALACVGGPDVELSATSWRRLTGLELLEQAGACSMPRVSGGLGRGGWTARCVL